MALVQRLGHSHLQQEAKTHRPDPVFPEPQQARRAIHSQKQEH